MTKFAKIIISALVTLGLVIMIWRYLDFEHLTRVLVHLRWPWFAMSVAMLGFAQWLRACRLHRLLHISGGRWRLFNTICLYGLLSNTLPTGLAEPSLVYLLKKKHDIPLYSGTAVLLAVRLADLMIMSVLLLIVSLSARRRLPVEIVLFSGLFLAVLLAVLGLGRIWLENQGIFQRIKGPRLMGWLSKHLAALAQAFESIRVPGSLGPLVVYSVSVWLVMYLCHLAMIYALGVRLSGYAVMLLYLLTFPVKLLPIRGVGDFGTHEAVWFVASIILGLEAADSALLGFGTHIIFLMAIVITAQIPLISSYYSLVARKAER